MAYAISLSLGVCAFATLALFSPVHSLASEIVIKSNTSGVPIVSVTGQFEFGDEKKFVTQVLNLANAIIEFDSPGGSLQAGIEIGRAIRLKGFTTSVRAHSICASACGFAWLGGTRREVQEGASVGFHAAYTMEAGVAKETGVGNAVLGSYLNQLGLTQRAIEYATIASPESMTWLTEEDGQALGIEFSIVAARTQNETKVAEAPEKAPEYSRGSFSSSPKLDILGCDIGEVRRQVSLAECEAGCLNERKCAAYTYQLGKKACFLKSCAVWAVKNDDVTSGLDWKAYSAVTRLSFSLRYGVDTIGGDYKNLGAATLVDCVRACRDESDCGAFSYVSSSKNCSLKGYLWGTEEVFSIRVVSGRKVP